MHLLGTHGTCRSRAKTIVDSQKFCVSEAGYGGSGAYFWACVNGFHYGFELAECWWAFSNHKQRYKDDSDSSLAVLGATIKAPESSRFFDATDVWFLESLYSVLRTKGKSEDDLPEVTEMLIGEMQAKGSVDFQVVKMLVTTPPLVKGRVRTAAQMISKASHAYLVKHSGLDLIEKIELLDTGGNDERTHAKDTA